MEKYNAPLTLSMKTIDNGVRETPKRCRTTEYTTKKSRGQQVGSLFADATDKKKIKAIYGTSDQCPWLLCWILDIKNYVRPPFMLLDKNYYERL